VRRRICLVGVTLSVCLLASVAGTAVAASSKSSGKYKVSCSVSTTIAVASGQTDVLPPVAQGSEYGPLTCGKLGSGVQKDAFTVPLSGDTVAKYTMYFGAGTIHGTYDISPQSSSLNFLASTWMGTLKVLGGTGAYKAVTGTGTMKCGSQDGIHVSCTDKLKLKNLTAG
jgi:hypothetical protein